MPIDIVLLTGFLGSGKTTLLKRILTWPEDLSGIVVLVNEFGEVGLDGKLLEEGDANVIELTSGCICCSLKSDLFTSLDEIAKLSPRLLLIEATGVAKPMQVVEVLSDGRFADLYRLTNVITVFDLEMWEAREVMGTLFWDQLTQANMIIANKIDVLSDEVGHRFLLEMQAELPGKVIVPASYCDVEPGLIFPSGPVVSDAGFMGLTRMPEDAPPFQSFVFTSSKPVSKERLEAFLSGAPKTLFRVKGPVRTHEKNVFLNFANGRTEWQPGWDTDETQLVLIGQGLDEASMMEGLNRCAD